MLKDKIELEKYLESVCDKIVIDNEKCKAVYAYANEKYDIPKGFVSDLVARRISMSEASEFVLFILLDSMYNTLKKHKIVGIDQFYTMQETQFYRKSKYEIDTIKFPLVFKMIQVEDDQWIGKIDFKTLMKLRRAQLINYNVNAQRTMQKIVRGDKEHWKITVNQKAVRSIAENFKNHTFIANSITLNIPIEVDSDFYYNKEDCSLVINSLEKFHITDGYHRYLAACQISDIDPEFDYNMELRIVNWDDIKAQSFIWQEDQKTPLKKIDSEAFNMNKPANIIVERLNKNVYCNLKGLIDKNQGIINFSELAMLVDWFYIKNKNIKGNQNAMQLQVMRELTEDLNILTESNIEYLEKPWNYKLLIAAMTVFDYYKKGQKDKRDMPLLVAKVYNEISQSNNPKFKNKTPRKGLIDVVNQAIENNL